MSDSRGRFVKLYEKLFDNPVWTKLDPAVFKVFAGCLYKANFKDTTWYDGSKQVVLEKGSFVTASDKLAEFCGLSRQQVRTALRHLENLEIIACKPTNRWTMITLLNYGRYNTTSTIDQPAPFEKSTSNQPASQPASQPAKNGANRLETNQMLLEECTYQPADQPAQNGKANHELTTVVEGIEVKNYTLSAKNAGVRPPEPIREPKPESVPRKRPPKEPTETEILARSVAAELYARHPAGRRCIGVKAIEDRLLRICGRKPPAEQITLLHTINQNHASLCASHDWRKEGGQYAKSLDNWLAPTMGRWEEGAPLLDSAEEESGPPAHMILH